jgi:phosphate transport system substrate-binding protein
MKLARCLACLRKSLALLAAVFFIFPLLGQAADLTLGGTGGDLGTMQVLGEIFETVNPGSTVEVLPSLGSGGGIKAVLAGAIDLSISSRPLKDKERAKGAKATSYAKTALVFATPLSNPQIGLTRAEVIEIYAGERTTWSDGTLIRLVLRPRIDTDVQIVMVAIPGMAAATSKAAGRRGLPIGVSDQAAADLIQGVQGGMGTSSLSLILGESRPLKALALDGVAPTLASIKDGTYPMLKTFHFVIGPNPSELAQKFIAFVRSAEGTAILRRTGDIAVGAGGDQ